MLGVAPPAAGAAASTAAAPAATMVAATALAVPTLRIRDGLAFAYPHAVTPEPSVTLPPHSGRLKDIQMSGRQPEDDAREGAQAFADKRQPACRSR